MLLIMFAIRGRYLNREDVYLVLFPSTLDSLAYIWFNQFEHNCFATWCAMDMVFYEAFHPSNYKECILDKLENLTLQQGGTFGELMN